MSATAVHRPAARRQRVQALLAYKLESLLNDRPGVVSLRGLDSPWDLWWVCVRSGRTAEQLGLGAGTVGSCQRCERQVRALTATALGPAPGGTRCDCMDRWAKEMRHPGPGPDWPELRAQVAMVKPGADVAGVRAYLDEIYEVVFETQRQLTSLDVGRLYPDAYGATYVEALTEYLTSGAVRVLVLAALPSAIHLAAGTKGRIRGALGGTDPFRNYLHMPDNPGEALCDIEHLAGADVLRGVYERYDGDRTHQRLACYRDLLATR